MGSMYTYIHICVCVYSSMARGKGKSQSSAGGRPPVEFEPQKVLGHRVSQNDLLEFHIQWKGFTTDEATWEPASALVACTDVLDEYYSGPVEFEPERILGYRKVYNLELHNVLHLHVLWKGFPRTEATWEPASALAACTDVQMEYYREKPLAPMSLEFEQYYNEENYM